MRVRSLKTDIFLTISVFLLIALFIGNLVTVMFWQREMIRFEYKRADRIINTHMKLSTSQTKGGGTPSLNDVQDLHTYLPM